MYVQYLFAWGKRCRLLMLHSGSYFSLFRKETIYLLKQMSDFFFLSYQIYQRQFKTHLWLHKCLPVFLQSSSFLTCQLVQISQVCFLTNASKFASLWPLDSAQSACTSFRLTTELKVLRTMQLQYESPPPHLLLLLELHSRYSQLSHTLKGVCPMLYLHKINKCI